MSATNHTSNYELSQYIGSDEPKYLTDYNGDMSKIDVAIKSADTKAETANTGVATNASAISALDGAVGTMQTQLTTVAGVANGNTASINTINSLLGHGEPTTTDKTVIGAINEIYADITGGGTDIDADNIDYDNTTSGLTATNVQDAIDEIATGGAVVASAVGYDNTTSGLTATNVQSAVDEVNGKFGGSQIRYNSTSQKMEYSSDGGTTWANFSGALSLDEVESAITTVASNNAQTSGTFSGTQTYTFVDDHDEVLITNQCFLVGYNDVTGSNTATHTVALTITTDGGQTITEFHDDNEYISGAPNVAGPFVKFDRKTVHLEDVKAGDTITFSYSASFTYVRATSGRLEGEYVIMTVN